MSSTGPEDQDQRLPPKLVRPAPVPDERTIADDSKTLADSGAGPRHAREPRPAIQVPDHQLLTCIGRGSYGEVWLARNVMGTFRAVKIVYRAAFEHARPFEREFNGIQKFEPLSRSHDGFVDVLQIGRTPEYFYYVMELADDVVTGQQIDPAIYEPKTLRSQVQARRLRGAPQHGVPPSGGHLDIQDQRSDGRLKPELHASELGASEIHALPFEECVELGLSLTAALSHLHGHGLIHRDIKPSNIIFVNGIPKLADIGLVAEQSEAKSFVGTEGFIPPEGPGTPQADIYSLGKVLYEMATGKDRHEFPALPTLLGDSATETHLLELNSVFLKACQTDVKQRYPSAAAMRNDLLLLQSGKSVKRAQSVERRLALLVRLSAIGITATALIAAALLYLAHQAKRESALRRQTEAAHADAQRAAYAAEMLLAFDALEKGNLGRLRELLNHYAPGPKQSGIPSSGQDVRGWEWYYLDSCTGSEEQIALKGHSNLVFSAFLLPDMQTVVSATRQALYFWDITSKTNQQIPYLPGFEHAALSPDAKWLAACGDQGWSLWDMHSRKLVYQETNWMSATHGIAFSRDSKRVAAAGNVVRVYDLASRQTIGRDISREDPDDVAFVIGLAFAPDGRTLAYGHGDDRIVLLDLSSSEETTLGKAAYWEALTLAYSPDGRWLVSGDREQITVWDVARRTKVREISGDEQIVSVAFSPDGKRLAAGGGDHTIRLWETANWTQVGRLQGHEGEVFSVAFSSNGQQIVSASKDGSVRLWKVPAAEEVRYFRRYPLSRTASHFPSCPLMIFDPPKAVYLDCPSLRETDPIHVPLELAANWTNGALAQGFASEGQIAALLLSNGVVQVWNTHPFKQLPSVGRNGAVYTTLVLGDLGEHCGLGLTNNALEIWDVRLNRCVCTVPPSSLGDPLGGPPRFISGFAARDQCFFRYFEQPDQTVEVWFLKNMNKQLIRLQHRDGVNNLVISADASLLASSAWDGELKFFDPHSGKQLERIHGQLVGFQSLAFSSDASRLAAAAWDGSITLFNTQSQPFRPVGRWRQHDRNCQYIRFVDQDRTIICTGDVRLPSGEWQHRLTAATAPGYRQAQFP